MLTLDYIGSKKSLLSVLASVFNRINVTSNTVFGDLFAGTGSVSHFVSKRYNANVISNDLLYFASVVNKAKLTKYSKNDVDVINRKIDEYNGVRPIKGNVTKHFAPLESSSSRMYFTIENAMKIDGVRTVLEKDYISKRIEYKHYVYLLAALISATDRVSNVSVVYAAYLKEFKRSALQPLHLEYLNKEDIVKRSARVYNLDAMDLTSMTFDVVYLDPPYNSRQYGDNYHVLESIAKYDDFNLHGVTGLPDDIKKSKFASKVQVLDEFEKLIRSIRAKAIVLSYNSEGLLSKKQIMDVLKKKGKTKVKTIKYKKFKAQQGVKEEFVYEYIFVCDI